MRALTSVALLLFPECDVNDPRLDETRFWRGLVEKKGEEAVVVGKNVLLDPDTVVALVKLYTVQCSYEFDYGVYLTLPPDLLLC